LEGQDRKIILDGELYVHNLEKHGITGDVERFGFISSCCKTTRTNPHENENLMQFHIFDVIVPDNPKMDQCKRRKILDDLFEKYNAVRDDETIQKVYTQEIFSESSLSENFASIMEQGYEGIVLRDKSLIYNQGKREQKMRKYKEFYDDDFIIVDAEKAEGTQEGCVVWICETQNGERFNSTMKGTLEFRRLQYENRNDSIGKLLKVRHQTPSEEIEEGVIPRFPVGLGIREDM